MSDLEFSAGLDLSEALSAVDDLAGQVQSSLDAAFADVSSNLSSALSEAGGGDATAGVDQLSGSLDQVSTSATDAGTGMSGFASNTQVAGGAAGLAAGRLSGVGTAASGMGGAIAAASGFAVALGGGLGVLFNKGLDATSALQRFNMIVGDMAKQVLSVNVGSLNMQLDDLAIKMGSDDEAVRAAAATIYQYAQNAGIGKQASADYADQVVALAARAVALNPALGTVDQVTQRLTRGLATGGRFANMFNLALTSQEITARALANTHKTTAAELTNTEKSMAGAQIAAEKYGSTLGKTIAEGSQNAIIQQRSLKEQIDNVLEAVGKPLVSPVLEAMKAGIPAIEAFATALGKLGEALLPALITALEALTPPLQALSAIMDALGPVLPAVAVGFLAMEAATTVLPVVLNAVGAAFTLVGVEAVAAGTDVAIASAAMYATPIGLLAGGLALAATAFGLLSGSADNATQSFAGFIAEINKVADTQLVATFEKQVHSLDDIFGSAVRAKEGLAAFKAVADDNVGTAQRLLTALNNAGQNTDGYAKILSTAIQKDKDSKVAKEESKTATDALTGSTQSVTTSVDAYTEALRSGATETNALAAAGEAGTTAIQTFQNTLAAAAGGALGYAAAQQNVAKAQQDLNDAIAKYGPDTAEANAAQLALNQAQLAGAVAAQSADKAQQDLITSLSSGNTTYEAQIGLLYEQLALHPANAAGIQLEVDKLNAAKVAADQIPGSKSIKLTVDDQASGPLSAIEQSLRRVFGFSGGEIPIGVAAPGTGKRAAGGPVLAGRTYLVGERGPEILSLGASGGMVIPNREIAQSLRKAGAGTGTSGGGVVIEHAVFGDTGVIADLDYWARTRLAGAGA